MEILEIIKKRFSPYEFTDKAISENDLKTLFKAAGKAASAFNEQPWRFIYALKEDSENFNRLHECLLEGNQGWTKSVSVLVITVVKTKFSENDNVNRVAEHDLGLAMGNLSIQALSSDIYIHQMAGIDIEKTKKLLNIPKGYEPVTAFALGYYEGEPDIKPRKEVDEITFKGIWN